jgi:hypothetical protein
MLEIFVLAGDVKFSQELSHPGATFCFQNL